MSQFEQPSLVTLLSPPLAALVDQVAPRELVAYHTPDASGFMSALRARPWRAAALDPTSLSIEALEQVAMGAGREGHRLLLLAPVTALAARRIVVAAHHAPIHVVLTDCESTQQLVAHELRRLDVASMRASLLSAVKDAVDVFPPSMCAAAVSLFGVLPLPRSSVELAHRVGCSRRTVDRWSRRAGFRGAASLLRAVRLAWACEMSQQDGGGTWRGVSSDCGYGSARTLRSHSRRILGLAPAKLGRAERDTTSIAKLAAITLGPSRRSRRLS